MKRITPLILLCLSLLSLASCSQPHPTGSETGVLYISFDIEKLSDYLDELNFTAGVSQGEFISMTNQYSYNGKPIEETASGIHYDGDSGGGWSASCQLFDFYNSFTVADDRKYSDYSNSLHTKVPLEGLTLPYGIDFDDTLTTALKKLGFNIDPSKDLAFDEGTPGIMTLSSGSDSSFELRDLSLVSESSASSSKGYELKYTQTQIPAEQSEKAPTVTRHIILSFAEGGALISFEVSVNERNALQ
ncbi:MAG: hypothetical protein E7665_00130 [Ruminococcaceae bacterium]|nr:hypothetical protein [Oscillospiraceae bacterium]